MGPVSINFLLVILLHLFQNINTSDLVIRAGQYNNIVSFMFFVMLFVSSWCHKGALMRKHATLRILVLILLLNCMLSLC